MLPLAKDTVPSCEPRDTNLAHAKLMPALDFQPGMTDDTLSYHRHSPEEAAQLSSSSRNSSCETDIVALRTAIKTNPIVGLAP